MKQCNAINRFVDERVSDYYENRSSCIQKSIRKNDGDFETAMGSCKNYHDFNIMDWAGDGKSPVNKLIESTAKWAGMSDVEDKRIVNLTKAFIGDTVIKRGELSVDFGPRRVQLTPRTYLMEVRATSYQRLCRGLLPKIMSAGGYKANIYRIVSAEDLADVNGQNENGIDHQSLQSLVYLPGKQRRKACRKVADALALGIYSIDMSKTLDFISSKMAANPHLPSKRKMEADLKRRAFKDHVELTLTLSKENSAPLNEVLFQLNQSGERYRDGRTKRGLRGVNSTIHQINRDRIFFDCGDGLTCR